MNTKSRSCHRTCGALAAVCAAILPVVAEAQDPAIDRIEAIERQIRGLQSELQHLKSELGEAKQQLRQSCSEAQRAQGELREARQATERERQHALKAATATRSAQAAAQTQAAAAAPPAAAVGSEGVKVSMPEGRPTIATADGRLSLAIGGFLQLDSGGYFQNPNQNTQFPQLNNGINLRRGRLYFVGKFDDFRVNITPDFGGSPDGAPTLFEANVNYTGIKPVTATVGYFHPFVSLEDATFPGNLLFLERPSIINIERSVAAGIQRASLGANAATPRLFRIGLSDRPPFWRSETHSPQR
jgi:phosphate-selective porin OprO and OprP